MAFRELPDNAVDLSMVAPALPPEHAGSVRSGRPGTTILRS